MLHIDVYKRQYDYLNRICYKNSIQTPINLPSSDVLGFELEGGSKITIRPSGTEPKLKIYYSLRTPDRDTAVSYTHLDVYKRQALN